MTARSPLTPELVEQRLSELQALSRLGASLLDAELPPIDRRQLERRSLRVVGRARGAGCDPRDVRLHVAASPIARHLGWMPDAWVEPDSGLLVGTGLAVLVAIWVDDVPCDTLPRGQAGTATLRFLIERPACVAALPLLERSDHGARLWSCLQRDRQITQW
ncbi:MAG TPA: hypothetical protein VHT91_32100 [Kofleriaceae bacterium]|nr:hypothetical protein [Kofleriaceae bacterium]